LKKRTKKLLSVSAIMGASALGETPDAICKSFLLLFFKKEVSLPCRQVGPASPRCFG
jgi:hypothetical protein